MDVLNRQGTIDWLDALNSMNDDLQGTTVMRPTLDNNPWMASLPMSGPVHWQAALPVFLPPPEPQSTDSKTDEGSGESRGRRPASAKPRRKRGPTPQQQVAELQKQLAEHTEQFQLLSIKNVWLSERVRMLELLIAAKDESAMKLQQIQNGLAFNPLAILGTTPEEFQKSRPSWLGSKFVEMSTQLAGKLALLQPHLQQHPHLFWGPTPDSRWAPESSMPPPLWLSNGPTADMVVVKDEFDPLAAVLLARRPSVDAAAVKAVRELVMSLKGLETACQYMFWMKPELLLTSSMHVYAFDNERHVNWDNLWTTLTAAGRQAVAPEGHWQHMVRELYLTDKQKLQASVLQDLIMNGLQKIAAQRSSLSLSMQQQYGHNEGFLSASTSVPYDSRVQGQLQGTAMPMGQLQQQPSDVSGPSRPLASLQAETIAAAAAEIGSEPRKLNACVDRLHDMNVLKKLQITVVKEGCLVHLGAEALFFSILTPDPSAILHAMAAECTPAVLSKISGAANSY